MNVAQIVLTVSVLLFFGMFFVGFDRDAQRKHEIQKVCIQSGGEWNTWNYSCRKI